MVASVKETYLRCKIYVRVWPNGLAPHRTGPAIVIYKYICISPCTGFKCSLWTGSKVKSCRPDYTFYHHFYLCKVSVEMIAHPFCKVWMTTKKPMNNQASYWTNSFKTVERWSNFAEFNRSTSDFHCCKWQHRVLYCM